MAESLTNMEPEAGWKEIPGKIHAYINTLHDRLLRLESYLTDREEGEIKCDRLKAKDVVEAAVHELRICIARVDRIGEIVKKIK